MDLSTVLRQATIVAVFCAAAAGAQSTGSEVSLGGSLKVYDAEGNEEHCQGKTLLLLTDEGLSVSPAVCRFDSDCRWNVENATLLKPQGNLCICSGSPGYYVSQPTHRIQVNRGTPRAAPVQRGAGRQEPSREVGTAALD